ncbi:ricin-type beta-trefoil lectin domain protein [Pleionea sp. CnH1-48]|uniref:ricin-type beta-trefoil lectin domain protein n=1 Tax=Pleionea sp. CnH1-48 TaxID=2954494 RepID=UPI0020969079|nr:ricin-type beta-trefoil lectin domain protein [Pleionea sp. CnH1-48]MCO7224217.1 ricin-type beta-trefoil lectin domain protein [Pleionea sp. CnH1-48]
MNKAAVVSFALLPFLAQAGEQVYADSEAFFKAFHKNPKKVMDQMPLKETRSGGDVFSSFNEDEIGNKDYVVLKDQYRSKIMGEKKNNKKGSATTNQKAMGYWDNPKRLIDLGNNAITNLFKLDSDAPRAHQLESNIWSDTYWPIYSGTVGWRHADPEWNRFSRDWKTHHDFATIEKPAQNFLAEEKHLLSPSEKYDLLVGDSEFSMTRASWATGKGYYDRDGKVETWMGLCHGWAPAAYMLPRPEQTIVVKDAEGNDLTFYPSDVKALGTLLWSNGDFQNKFMGSRCNIKDPKKDENGRVLEPQCFDNNPASFHIAVINQLGLSNRSVIMDATYDYEVWNQPIYSYKIKYVNLKTSQSTTDVNAAVINIEDYTEDKFKSYRSTNATKIVGVRMELEYISENQPNHDTTNSSATDEIVKVHYYYDLELNDAGEILGGEWYSNRHPDFLWTPVPNAVAQSTYQVTGEWNEGQSIPESWKRKAKLSSDRHEPLTAIVSELFKRASKQAPTTTFQQISLGGDQCLDFYLAKKRGDDYIETWTCSSETYLQEQLWLIDSQSRLRPKHDTNLCLSVSSLTAGEFVTLESCNQSDKQQWTVGEGSVKSKTRTDLELKPANGGTYLSLQ